MTFSIQYKPLFSVNLLHKYYLNKGTNDFFAMDQAESEKQLAGYNVSYFLKITPSADTAQKMKNHRLVFKMMNTGFFVWAQVSEVQDTDPLIEIHDQLELTFLLKLVNHTFINFTNLDAYSPGKLFFFSNKRPLKENPSFTLINTASNHQAVTDDYLLSQEGFAEVTDKLNSAEKQQLFGLIRISMKGDDASLDVTDAQNRIHDTFRKFQLVFENRQTYWRYIFRENQKVKPHEKVTMENESPRQFITKNAQPLTETGFVSIELDGKELPNPDALVIKPDTANNKIYSEIYM